MKILAVDPGKEKSAVVGWDGENILKKNILLNNDVFHEFHDFDKVIIEMISCYGMPVGKTTFETVLWIGRFIQFLDPLKQKKDIVLVYRQDIKLHFCHSVRAKDSNIRQALIDRFGPVGSKKNQGYLYGIKADMWSALAIAVFYWDKYIAKIDEKHKICTKL